MSEEVEEVEANDEEQLREALPLIHSTTKHSLIKTISGSSNRLFELIRPDPIEAVITEKTDGMALEMGVDSFSFYMRTSSSPKYRFAHQFDERARALPHLSSHFTALKALFKHLESKRDLTDWLENKPALKGEMFFRPLAKRALKSTIRFNLVDYDIRLISQLGRFVVHSQLEPRVDIDELAGKFNDEKIDFDDDLTLEFGRNYRLIHAQEQAQELLYHGLVNLKSVLRFRHDDRYRRIMKIAEQVNEIFLQSVIDCRPRWGDETEGWVFHTKHGPKVKVWHPTFIQKKEMV